MKKCFYLSFLTLILFSPPSYSSHDPTEFESWILNRNFFPDIENMERAGKYRYFFVTGFLSEMLQWSFVEYYYDNLKEFRHRGIPESNLIRPISLTSSSNAADNAEKLYRIISEQGAGEQRDLVFIGHSKGALELLLMSLNHLDFIKKRVRAVFLLQGAIGGSPIADYLAGETVEGALDKLNWWQRPAFELLMVPGSGVRTMFSEGLHSLTRRNARALWRDIWLGEEEQRLLKERLFFICSKKKPRGDLSLLDVLGQYIYVNFGENDGLVLLEDQYIEYFGTRLATLTANHSDLVLRANAETRWMRKGLSRAIVQWVGGID